DRPAAALTFSHKCVNRIFVQCRSRAGQDMACEAVRVARRVGPSVLSKRRVSKPGLPLPKTAKNSKRSRMRALFLPLASLHHLRAGLLPPFYYYLLKCTGIRRPAF